jgi:hypothetical protein
MPGETQAQSAPHAGKSQPKPVADGVLPTAAYVVLVAEAAALTWFYATHEVAPGDPIGHSIGWAGSASMVAMHVYSLRKRVRALSSWGRLGAWLQLHIFLGLQGALLVSFHSLHLTRLFNISGTTILLTLIVVVSGTFGRYLYSWLPRNLTGERLSAREIEGELGRLAPVAAAGIAAHPELAAAAGPLAKMPPLTGRMTLGALIAEDRRTRRALAVLDGALTTAARTQTDPRFAEFTAALRRRAALTRRLTALTAAERMFRNWHLFHKPLTVVLLGAVVLHVVAHYIYAARFAG